MHLNLLDYIFAGILLLSALAGLRRGFIDALGGITGTLGAIVAAIIFYDNCIFYLEQEYGLTSLLSDLIRQKAPITTLSTDKISIGLLSSDQSFVDMAHHLAYLIIMISVFLLILLIVGGFLKLVFKMLNKLFSWGALGGVNKILGMVLIAVKNLIIIAVIAGIMQPAIQTAAQMGWNGALIANKFMLESYFLADILNIFSICKELLGMNS